MAEGYEPKLSNLHGERVTVTGTTTDTGTIAVSVGLKYAYEAYVITNVASAYDKRYLVTVDYYNSTNNTVTLRIRNISDHSAVGNTEVNFTALIFGIIAE